MFMPKTEQPRLVKEKYIDFFLKSTYFTLSLRTILEGDIKSQLSYLELCIFTEEARVMVNHSGPLGIIQKAN